MALALALAAPPTLPAADEPSAGTQLALRFVQGLRDRGYADLAVDYLEGLRTAGDTPDDLRSILDLEEGSSLLEEANGTAESNRRGNLFEQARAKLEKFLKEHPEHPLAGEALKKVGRAYLDDGHLAMLLGQEAKSPNEAESRTVEARTLFARARDAYARAEAKLKAAYDALPKSVSEDDPLRARRDRALIAWIEARLQGGLVDYEEAQTYKLAEKKRDTLLEKGVAAFEEIAQHHRTQMAGVVARMWEAKCYEERGRPGDFGRAIGIYDELMAEPDPRLKPLQRQVDYFRIVLKGRRNDYAAAADDAANWLKVNAKERHTEEGLGVLVELGRGLLAQAQAPEAKDDPSREAAIRKASDVLKEVVKAGASRHKPSAVRLLRQVKAKPKGAGAAGAAIPANIKADEALNQGDEATEAGEFDQALAFYRAALRKIDPGKDLEKFNNVRGQMAFCLYEAKRYDESAIVAEHLARGYPKSEIGPKAAMIGIAARGQAFDSSGADDPGREEELDRLSALADYAAKTWPDTDQADEARFTIANIAGVRGKHIEAARALEGVRDASPRRAEALARAAASHVRQAKGLQADNKADEAKAEFNASIEQFKLALKARADSKAPPTDKDLLSNACDLADVYLFQDRPKDALDLLDPLSKAVADKKPSEEEAPARARLIERMLRALIGMGEVNRAIDEMKALETSGGSGQSMATLYFSLGRLLEKEMAILKEKGDQAALAKTRETYQKFLDALAASESGQSYDSLEWAGEAMLSLGAPDKAAVVLDRVLKAYGNDAKLAEGPKKMLHTRLELAIALRQAKQFDRAQKELDLLLKTPNIVYLKEQGYLLEDKAATTKEQADWEKAASQWRGLAVRLGRGKSKTIDYYDAWYHTALAQSKQGNKAEAVKSLRGIMTLSPSVGGPEMKKKYDDLLSNLSGAR